MRFLWSVVTWAALSLGGLSLFGYSMMKQTEIQRHMNGTMTSVNEALSATTPLVAKTFRVLAPLEKTTHALYEIERNEQLTVVHLAGMNTHLSDIATTERALNADMDVLYVRTIATKDAISGVSNVNQAVLSSSQESGRSANQMANQVGQINQFTKDSITQLHTLNQKLSALKILP